MPFEASRPGATAMQVGIDENAEGEVITLCRGTGMLEAGRASLG